jgi:hypothetical protein
VIKQRTIWEASDGRVFDDQNNAAIYESKLSMEKRVKLLHDFLLEKVPKKQASMWPLDCANYLFICTDEAFEFIRRLKEEKE